jgi:polyisoprenoid-binding protein YceI
MAFKIMTAACMAALLAACGAPPARQTPAHTEIPPVQAPSGAAVYRIDSSGSELRLLVYRAGAMARLGHNHVISNRALSGWVQYTGDAGTARFSLLVPVADFVVDDAQLRSTEGAEFEEPVNDDAKAGTRHNMLSAALLDGDRYPAITLRSTAISETAAGMNATVSVEVAGHESSMSVPFKLDRDGGRLSASGTVVVRQSALGLTPYSVMLGALQVQDELTVKFTLVAVKS